VEISGQRNSVPCYDTIRTHQPGRGVVRRGSRSPNAACLVDAPTSLHMAYNSSLMKARSPLRYARFTGIIEAGAAPIQGRSPLLDPPEPDFPSRLASARAHARSLDGRHFSPGGLRHQLAVAPDQPAGQLLCMLIRVTNSGCTSRDPRERIQESFGIRAIRWC